MELGGIRGVHGRLSVAHNGVYSGGQMHLGLNDGGRRVVKARSI